MELRERIAAALRAAEGDARRSATLRLVMAAIRDRDQAERAESGARADSGPGDEAELRAILTRLAAQRRASAQAFELEGRLEQAADKAAEAAVIEALLPPPMARAEIDALVEAVVRDLDARSLQDIGRVMAVLKPRLSEQIDAATLKAMVRARLE